MYDVPLISVIIPSYNSPDIFQTLDSVLMQDYPRIQLIIVDDASACFSRAETEDYLRQRGRGNLESLDILENPENRGTVYTLNRALQHFRGEYIFVLACDDCFYDSSVLSDWVAEFIRTGAQVITACRAVYDEALTQCLEILPTAGQRDKLRRMSPPELFEEIAGTNFIFGCCTARTAATIHKYGLYDSGYRLIEDHPMNLKLLRMGEPIVFFDRIVVKYRGGGTSSPSQYNESYRQDVDRIFSQEILPFTKQPFRTRLRHYLWKRDQRLLQQRQALWDRFRGNRLAEIAVLLLFYIRRPCQTLCAVFRRIKKIADQRR